MSQSLTERYDDRIAGMLSCYDRLVITGTLPVICYAAGMTGYLNAKGIRIFDYPEFAKTLRDRVRDRAATLAAEAGITIEHIAKPHIRKEDVVARVLRQRGDRPGLVHVISAMEACDAYKPWHDKQTHKTFIRPDSGKCLHYYFYFQDATFGLVYLRVPTWAPFRLQFYCNGHSWLARKLSAKGIGYTMADNAFVHIDDWALAQAWPTHCRLTSCTARWIGMPSCIARYLMCSGSRYHWSLMRWNTPPIWRSAPPSPSARFRATGPPVGAEREGRAGRQVSRPADHAVAGAGDRLAVRHPDRGHLHQASLRQVLVKMYDKHGIVLRIETTANDVSFFKHHRRVEHRKGRASRELAPVKKSIYSLIDLRDILLGCNRRYIAHLSALDDFSAGFRALGHLTRPREVDGKTVQGINFFAPADKALLHALQNPRVNIAGIRRSQLLPHLGMFSPTRLSRHLRRLLDLGVIKRVTGTYRYYLTKAGRAATAAAERITEAVLIPAMI